MWWNKESVSNISKIEYGVRGFNHGTAYVDNVKVYLNEESIIDDHFNNDTIGSAPEGWTVTEDEGTVVVQILGSSDSGELDEAVLTAVVLTAADTQLKPGESTTLSITGKMSDGSDAKLTVFH